MNAAVSQEKGGYDANHFRYENVMEEIEEIEALLAWYEAWVQRRSWSAWQSWVVLAAAVVSGILSVLALWVN